MIASIVVVGTSCTATVRPPQTQAPSSPAQTVETPLATETPLESILRLARENGAGPDQIALLSRAVERGEIPFEDVRAAVDATYACLDRSGIGHIEEPRDPNRPFAPIVFSVEVADAAMEALADGCVFGESYWIQSAYEQQPAATEARDVEFEQARPVIIQCLVDHGIDADSSMTNSELKELLIYSETGIDRTGDGIAPASWEPMGCMEAAGINGF